VRKNIKGWDELLPHAEFAFNMAPSKTTRLSSFQVVYGCNPRTPLDLTPLPIPAKYSWEAEKRAKEIKDLHAQVQERIEKVNSQVMQQVNKHKKGVQFHPRHLVWIHMRKERFQSKRKSKIMPRFDGPFEILEQIGPNAYKVDLSGDYGVSATFNVADLRPHADENEDILSLRSNSIQPGEDDGDHPIQPMESHVSVPHQAKGSSRVKEVQVLVRNMLDQSDSELCSSSGNWPDFVWLVELDPGGEISCTSNPLKA